MRPHFLDTKIPPPVVTAALAVLMWAVERRFPTLTLRVPLGSELGAVIALAGLALEVVALVTFRRVCTTVNPLRPAQATSLVTRGIYRFTRNPIYVGDLLVLLGWAVYLGNLAALVLTPLFVAYIEHFQIRPEERILAEKFGSPYDDYRARVRRWI